MSLVAHKGSAEAEVQHQLHEHEHDASALEKAKGLATAAKKRQPLAQRAVKGVDGMVSLGGS